MPKKNIAIDYDFTNMTASRAVSAEERVQEMSRLPGELHAVRQKLEHQFKTGKIGFMTIPERIEEIGAVKEMAKSVSAKFRTLVVIGIGGSDLGARALLGALKPAGKGMDVRFIGANTDPEEIAALLRDVDLKRTALNIISKSGDTIEPMSAFLLLRDRLIKAVGAKRHALHVIATTDEKGGTLRQIANREGYRTLPVPSDIGGRFSALTPVGLFPAACAGIDIGKLISGARDVRDDFFVCEAEKNCPLMFAGLQVTAYRHGHAVTVLMPYAEALRQFAFWFRQLWAESLGKKADRGGRTVHAGFTPVAALGATDQHSQIQLYNEGPADKTVTFIEVEKFRDDLIVPKPYPDIEGVAYMAGLKFSEIIHAERQATAIALTNNVVPNGTISIPSISGESVGGLMMFFMLATAVAAELLDVNAYDQPGVEAGKQAMSALLGRKGFSLK